METNTTKYKPTRSLHLKLNDADFALLPSPEYTNVNEWIRQAIREKHERENGLSATLAAMRRTAGKDGG